MVGHTGPYMTEEWGPEASLPGVASSLVSRGFLGTLPGDSSWKTEEGSTEHFPRWLVFSDGRWTVTGQYLRPA